MSSDLRLEASKKMRESRTKSPPPRRQRASSPRNHGGWKHSDDSHKAHKGGFDLDGDQDSSATTESDSEMEMRGRSRQPKPQNAGNSPQSETTDNEERTTSPAPVPMRIMPLTPDLKERAEDDIAVRPQPSRHVDYLSHNWREEELWMSWKFIVSRRGDYANAARLENASWRTWWKNKNNLKTVNPLELNWLKEADVGWLYGPLQTGTFMNRRDPQESKEQQSSTSSASARESQSGPFITKPILKKRSMSEIILQESLSNSTLVAKAAAAAKAQGRKGKKRPGLGRSTTDYGAYPFSPSDSHEGTSPFPSAQTSGIASPAGEKKHIHFNEQVTQCIAVDIKGDDDDDYYDSRYYDYDSDDEREGGLLMKRLNPKKRWPTPKRRSSHRPPNGESKTIAMLPSTTLKDEDDSEPSATVHRSPVLSPSSSQETLRPSKKSGIFFANSDDEDDVDSVVLKKSSSRSSLNRIPSSSSLAESSGSGLRRSSSALRLDRAAEPLNGARAGHLVRSSSAVGLADARGMGDMGGVRRSQSGIMRPLYNFERDSDEENRNDGGGFFQRITNMVNTARDILYIIWNVGWGGGNDAYEEYYE